MNVTRLLGLATAAYGTVIILRPEVVMKPCGLMEPDGSLPASAPPLVAAMGARDIAVGLGMALSRSSRTRRRYVFIRVVSDLSDAFTFGSRLEDPKARQKVMGLAGGWAGACAVASLFDR